MPPRSSRRLVIFLVALLGTFLALRAAMLFRPNADVNIAGYNIHHLFTGVLVVAVFAIPLIVAEPRGRAADLLTAGAGVGLSLALDEVVYLIVTDGSNQAYLSRASFVGGVVMIGAACIYAVLIWHFGALPRERAGSNSFPEGK